MARLFATSINLNKNELQNARIQNLSSAPSSPVAGQVYFNTTTNVLYFYDGTEWVPASGSTEVIQDLIGSSVIGGTGLTATYNDGTGETTIDLDDSGVVASSYGSNDKTLTLSINAQGQITSASETSINIATSQVENLQEYIEDTVGGFIQAGEGIDITYDDNTGALTIDAEIATASNPGVAAFDSTDFTVTAGSVTIKHEAIQDIVGSMVSGNSETGITVSYEDVDGTLDFEVADQFPTHTTSDLAEGSNLYYTTERVEEDVNSILIAGDGLDKAYDDGANTITLDVDSSVTRNTASQTLTNKILGSGTSLGAALDADGYKIIYVATPTEDGDAANKAYVDARVAGMSWKESVNLLYNDPTPTLSGDSVSSPLIIDGHAALGLSDVGYRILITNGNDAGIYVYNQTGTSWTLDRATDGDVYTELVGASVYVMEGSQYASTTWVQANHYLTDFTGQSWVQSSGAGTYSAGSGLTLSGTTFSVDVTPTSGNAGLEVTNGALNVKADTASGLEITTDGLGINNGTGLVFDSGALTLDTSNGYGVRKYATVIGNGLDTSFTITHNFTTRDVNVQIYQASTPYAQIEADVEHSTTSAVTVSFAVAPTTNEYRVVVVG